MNEKYFSSAGELAALHPSRCKGAVLAKGVYDLFHIGHLRSLQFASGHGDCLIVAIKTDELVRAQKGDARPIIPFKERRMIIEALEIVDFVIPMDSMKVAPLIETLEVSKFVASHFDSEVEQISMSPTREFSAIKLERSTSVSSSDIIDRILNKNKYET